MGDYIFHIRNICTLYRTNRDWALGMEQPDPVPLLPVKRKIKFHPCPIYELDEWYSPTMETRISIKREYFEESFDVIIKKLKFEFDGETDDEF